MENEISYLYTSYLYLICYSKVIEICPNEYADLHRILFTEDSLKTKKDLELISSPHFSQIFLIKKFILYYYINWPNLITRLCFLPKLFNKVCFVFHACALDDVMTFEYLNCWNLIISRTKGAVKVTLKTLFFISQVLSFRHTK